VLKGTRLSADFLLDLLGAGWTQEQLLVSYPTLSIEGLAALYAFAADSLRTMSFHSLPDSSR
jgi:uncharacterized protein (DUF433 family)